MLKEAMRLSPTNNIPLERRVPAEGFSVEGYDLPAGTNIAVSARMIHRNPDIYGRDVHTFQPERWLDATPDSLDRMKKYFFAVSQDSPTESGESTPADLLSLNTDESGLFPSSEKVIALARAAIRL